MVDVMMSRGLLVSEDSVLLIVDMQSRLLDAMPASTSGDMLINASRLLTAAKLLGVPVLLTEQYPKGLGRTADVLVSTLPDDTRTFEKTAFSCCGCVEFVPALAATGRRQIIIAGLETHVCVLQTAVDLLQLGYDVHMVEDAVCSRRDSHKHNALYRLRERGVTVTNHESVLFEWLRDARHGDFKTISALVR